MRQVRSTLTLNYFIDISNFESALYSVLDTNMEIIVANLDRCLNAIIPDNPAESERCERISGVDLFSVIIDVFYEYVQN